MANFSSVRSSAHIIKYTCKTQVYIIGRPILCIHRAYFLHIWIKFQLEVWQFGVRGCQYTILSTHQNWSDLKPLYIIRNTISGIVHSHLSKTYYTSVTRTTYFVQRAADLLGLNASTALASITNCWRLQQRAPSSIRNITYYFHVLNVIFYCIPMTATRDDAIAQFSSRARVWRGEVVFCMPTKSSSHQALQKHSQVRYCKNIATSDCINHYWEDSYNFSVANQTDWVCRCIEEISTVLEWFSSGTAAGCNCWSCHPTQLLTLIMSSHWLYNGWSCHPTGCNGWSCHPAGCNCWSCHPAGCNCWPCHPTAAGCNCWSCHPNDCNCWSFHPT